MDKTVKTFTATIYVGFLERDTGKLHTLDEARAICQSYVDEIGLCVTVWALARESHADLSAVDETL